MPQPSTNQKIDELRSRLKSDPKGRHFFPLAEELRKIGKLDEAESTLRDGLKNHPAYLSALVCLGRVLKEQGRNGEALDPLHKALQLDGGNVVTARLLADTYLGLGDKIEAIKKYKLVHALLPSDESLQEQIEKLEQEIKAGAGAPEPIEELPLEAEIPAAVPTGEGAVQEEAVPVFDLTPPHEEPQQFPVSPQNISSPAPSLDDTADEPFGEISGLGRASTLDVPFEAPSDVPAVGESSSPFGEVEASPRGSSSEAQQADGSEQSAFAEAAFEQESPFGQEAASAGEETFNAAQDEAAFEEDVAASAPRMEEDLFSSGEPPSRENEVAFESDQSHTAAVVESPSVAPARDETKREAVKHRLENWLSKVKRA